MKIIEFLLEHIMGLFILGMIGFVVLQVIRRERQQAQATLILKKALKSGADEPATLHPEVDDSLCSGCGACTKVCPEGDILKMIHHKAVLVSPTKCVGHGECERACPMNAIALVFGTKKRGMDIPRLTTNYETNVPGLYIAGELGGMGLIRNAVKQGFLATSHALKNLSTEVTDYDVVIVGAGPAGLAAALTAVAKRKKYICIEQNTFGGTVANFPRQKIVMTHPISLPEVGEKKFSSNKVSKEDLLAYWQEVRSKTGLQIKENVKFEGLEKTGNHFMVQTTQGVLKTQKVILGLGVRGSPRKLGVEGEDLNKVTYNLIDPEQYQGKAVAVVGGGNAGVEAAQMLAEARWKNKVHLLVRSGDFDRCNEDNINRIRALQKAGLVEIWFHSSVKSISTDRLTIQKEQELIELANDYVFVFAGAEMPHKFLMSLGINIDKKFGKGLQGAS